MNTDSGLAATGVAATEFAKLAADYLDDLARRHPDAATGLGDHRFDDLLPDDSGPARADERRALDGFAVRLDRIDTAALPAEIRVDAAMLADGIARRVFEIDELREHAWNPLRANPGKAMYLLLARDFAPLPDRLAALAGRLAQIPRALEVARDQLENMPKVHLETAISQFDGTIKLVAGGVDNALRQSGTVANRKAVDKARPGALEALAWHRGWLAAKNAENPETDPRIGPERFARKLSLTLSAQADSEAILSRAEKDLDRVTGEITELAAVLGGTPRQVLDQLAAAAPDESTILRFCAGALAAQTEFVRAAKLVTLYDDPVELIDMPEIDRGIAVAYCDSPGPLETTPLPTFLAVAPVPAGWTPERKSSFYREYNRHMVHNLMVHEAMPGHYLQLQHSRRFSGATRIRAALRSGAFIEGWAVYAEELMARHGYPGEGDPRTVRMQQLKMQLRTTINAILDARVHAHDMTEAQAMALMTGRGFQEEGEAAGKWRRTLLTSAQLSTYYVGYTEVSDLAAELTAAGGTEHAVHDRMLAHGSPPVRLLRTVA
ncbi:MAG TPA: DUF885 domain-containing protein [Trebonia sp.]|nr:DUF885 domain-containing protein [Trebonia sp.]